MKLSTLFALTLVALILPACGAGGIGEAIKKSLDVPPPGQSNPPTPPNPTTPKFITWKGNANGAWVSDANGDKFRFLADSRKMHIGNAIVGNVYVDRSADVYLDNKRIGSVAAVRSTTGSTIAGLVGTDGYFLDVYDRTSTSVRFQHTRVRPVPASNYSKVTSSLLMEEDEGAAARDGALEDDALPAGISEDGEQGLPLGDAADDADGETWAIDDSM